MSRLTIIQMGVLLASGSLLSGCALSTKQMMDAGLRVVDAIKSSEASTGERWRMTFSGAEYWLDRAPQPDGSSIFSDSSGLRIVFDGNEVRAVEGLPGAIGPLEVEINGRERRYIRGGNRTFDAKCNAPQAWRISPTLSGLRTRCWGELNGVRVYVQTQSEWSSSTTLIGISSTLVPGFAPLVLERLDP